MRYRPLLLALAIGLAALPAKGQEWCETVPDPSPPEAAEETPPKTDDPAPVIDLLAFAIPEAGPLASVRQYMEWAVGDLNHVLTNSQIPGSVRLLDVLPAPSSLPFRPYQEGDPNLPSVLAADLAVQRIRDERAADLVTLVVPKEMLPTFTYGIAFLARTASAGYSVILVDSISFPGGLVFAHEIGHNLGLPHDKANAGTDGGPYAPRAYGHWGQFPDGRWFQDVMSYGSACPGGCNAVAPFYSNPEITYLGVPMGVAGEREGALFVRDDAMRRIAAWRSITPPPPPSTGMITSSQYPNFRFWVRINDSRLGTSVTDCLPETVCVAGAFPNRAEVLVRIVGPKPNGYLWPTIVKFNTTRTEVWIEQVSTGSIKYYRLPALAVDSSELPGFVDKTGFLP